MGLFVGGVLRVFFFYNTHFVWGGWVGDDIELMKFHGYILTIGIGTPIL